MYLKERDIAQFPLADFLVKPPALCFLFAKKAFYHFFDMSPLLVSFNTFTSWLLFSLDGRAERGRNYYFLNFLGFQHLCQLSLLTSGLSFPNAAATGSSGAGFSSSCVTYQTTQMQHQQCRTTSNNQAVLPETSTPFVYCHQMVDIPVPYYLN